MIHACYPDKFEFVYIISFRYLPVLESLTADDLFRRTFEHYLAATGATETVADVRHDLVLQLLFG